MKILYVTTIGSTMIFFNSLIEELIEKGNVVDIATNESQAQVPELYKKLGCKIYHISTNRSPFSFGNFKAIAQIKKIVEENKYDIVHCHTPLAGMATRFACKKLRKKQGVKVIYTAHGFHFYKGAPKKNWLIYYPIEKICSKWTDALITINKEDYLFAKKKMKTKKIEYVPGVGVDTEKIALVKVDREKKRKELNVSDSAFLIFSVGELNKNKNHQIVIEALAKLNNRNIYYLIAGEGSEREELVKLAKEKNVNLILLGFRNDVFEILKCIDLYCLPSKREGLNVSLMEALASGAPVVCSNIRGNIDLIDSQYLFNPNNSYELSAIINCFKKSNGTYYNSFDINKVDYSNIIFLISNLYKSL